MAFQKEIRILNGDLYYVSVDYSTNKYGSIVSVNKRIITRLNNEAPHAEFKDGKITNIIKETPKIEIKQVETPEKSEVETEVETKDEIIDETNEEVTEINEDENMVELNEESIARKIEDRFESKNRAEKIEKELADQRNYIKGLENTLLSKLDGFNNNVNEKLDAIAKHKNDESAQSLINKMKNAPIEHIHNPKDDLNCPNGNCGHKLKKVDDHTVKCTGPNCNKEYALIDKERLKHADAYCLDCHTPLNSEKDEACPTCQGKKGNLYPK